MFCTQCGEKLPESAKFCSGCGAQTIRNRSMENTISREHQRINKNEIPDEMGKIDKKTPPKIAPLTLFFAFVVIMLILILLHPWHANQDRPKDFRGSESNQTMQVISTEKFIRSNFIE